MLRIKYKKYYAHFLRSLTQPKIWLPLSDLKSSLWSYVKWLKKIGLTKGQISCYMQLAYSVKILERIGWRLLHTLTK